MLISYAKRDLFLWCQVVAAWHVRAQLPDLTFRHIPTLTLKRHTVRERNRSCCERRTATQILVNSSKVIYWPDSQTCTGSITLNGRTVDRFHSCTPTMKSSCLFHRRRLTNCLLCSVKRPSRPESDSALPPPSILRCVYSEAALGSRSDSGAHQGLEVIASSQRLRCAQQAEWIWVEPTAAGQHADHIVCPEVCVNVCLCLHTKHWA